jgi:hypothetical protein
MTCVSGAAFGGYREDALTDYLDKMRGSELASSE